MLSNVQRRHVEITIKEGFSSLNEIQKVTNYSKADIQDYLLEKGTIKPNNDVRDLNS
jgi:hypothetical protein